MDIFDVNEELVKSLVKINKIQLVSSEFNKIKDNYNKVNYLEKLMVKFEVFTKLELKFDLRVAKSNRKSEDLRKEGNKCFALKQKGYGDALEYYNKSICFAEHDSEDLSIGYANRSAVYFDLKLYRECLENIKLARNCNYPERLIPKLDKREKACLDLIATQPIPAPLHEFALSYDKHPIIPYIADCLDYRYTKDLGRYVYTKKDLSPGDIVSIEEPFCTRLVPLVRYMRCANCQKDNSLSLIPCGQCTNVMYCSIKCQTEHEVYHKYECPIIDLLISLFNKIHLMALHVTLTAINCFDTIEECMSFCKDENNIDKCAFDLDYNNFNSKQKYRAIHGLVTNQEKRNPGDLFQRALIAATIRKYLLQNSPIKELLSTEEKVNFFTEILYKHLQTTPSNMHSIDVVQKENETDKDVTYATAAYSFASLLNHSCAPNVIRIHKGQTSHLFVIRPIPANGILYDNYGYHYALQPKNYRQKNLNTQYHFICSCEACTMDYPLFHELPVNASIPQEIQSPDLYKLMKYEKEYALENHQRYAEYLKKYAKYYPCEQLSSTEESYKMALEIIVDAIPFQSKI